MSQLVLFNKPYGVLCQFSGEEPNLGNYIDIPGVYPAGRLDKDSEGLVLLTGDGKLQARIADPSFKLPKTYWVQVEGHVSVNALRELKSGVSLKDGQARPAKARRMAAPLPERDPPVRQRENIPDSWIELTISEGKNRQVRRMTAAVGFPTLRLYRHSVGPWQAADLAPGQFEMTNVNLPVSRF